MVVIPVAKKYSIIYIDCPWDYKRKGGPKHIGTAAQWYPTLKDEEIYNLNVKDLAEDNCFLFSWSTWPKLKEGILAIESWGFRYVTAAFVWVKTNKKSTDTLFWGSGHYSRANTEVCLLGVKGKPLVINHGVHQVIEDFFTDDYEPDVLRIPNVAHSRKPVETRKRIEKLCGDHSKIEIFATENVQGWDNWGKDGFFTEDEPDLTK